MGLADEPVLPATPTISETTISMAELTAAIKQTKPRKRAGKDQVPNDFWKHLQGPGLDALLTLFQSYWGTCASPRHWKLAQVVGILKRGSASDPANYRPISLLQTCYKLYARIIANRLSAGLDEHIRELQFGFRKGRSTAEATFLVRRLQDLVDAKRHQTLHLLFLDWSKAFDKIRPAALQQALRQLLVPDHTIQDISDLVSNPLFEVLMDKSVSNTYPQRSGTRQGCTLSPLLFILLQTVLFHDVQVKYKARHPLATTPRLPFFDIELADDTVLIAETGERIQDLLWFVQDEAATYNLHLNTDKTKHIPFNSNMQLFFASQAPTPK